MINYKKLSAVLLAVLAYDSVVSVINHKRFQENLTLLKDAQELNEYFANKLDDHHVPMDEFDEMIVKTLAH